MPDDVAHYPRYRFPPAIISHAVWLYYRFTLSFRDVEDLLAQRAITVSYESIRHLRTGILYRETVEVNCQKRTDIGSPKPDQSARTCAHPPLLGSGASGVSPP